MQTQTTTPRVMDMDTGSALAGDASADLVREAAAAHEGAVPAYRDAEGVWQYVQPSQVEHVRRHLREEVRTVYVEGVGAAGRAGPLCRAVAALVGHDGTDSLRLIVERALRDNPSVTAEEVAEIVREQEAEAAAESEAPKLAASYYRHPESGLCVAVLTGMPEQAVRIGTGRTPRKAFGDLKATPLQSVGRDSGQAAALRWAAAEWDGPAPEELEAIAVAADDLDDTMSAWADE